MKDERGVGVGGGGAVHLRPIQRAGVLSAFGRFNERGCCGGCCPLSADSKAFSSSYLGHIIRVRNFFPRIGTHIASSF